MFFWYLADVKVKYCKRKTLNNGNWIFLIRPTKGGSGLHMISWDGFTDFCLLPCKTTMNSHSGLSVFELAFCLTPNLQRTDFKSATLLHQASHHFKMKYFKPDKAVQDLRSPKEVLAVPATPITPSITPQPPTVSQQHRYQRTLGSWKLKTCEAQADPRQVDFEGPTAGSGLLAQVGSWLPRNENCLTVCTYASQKHFGYGLVGQELSHCQTKCWTRRMRPKQFQAPSFLPVRLAKIVASFESW